MKDINDLMSEVLKDGAATVIIANPNIKGVKFDAPLNVREQLDKIFESKRKSADSLLIQIPELPDVAIPTISMLYDEARQCVLFALNGAAISLCAVLVEYALKYTIVKNKFGNDYKAEEWDRIEAIDFGMAIGEAKALDILDNVTEKKFQSFKDEVRNPYLHYNIKKLTKGVRADKIEKVNTKTQEVEEVQLNSETDPILWPHAKKFVDEKRVQGVLEFTCYAVELLCNRGGNK